MEMREELEKGTLVVLQYFLRFSISTEGSRTAQDDAPSAPSNHKKAACVIHRRPMGPLPLMEAIVVPICLDPLCVPTSERTPDSPPRRNNDCVSCPCLST